MLRRLFVVCCVAALSSATVARADKFTVLDEEGKESTIEARLAGSGQGAHALELDDGQYRIVPQGAVKERVPGDGPMPVSSTEMIARLSEKFGRDLFRAEEEKPFVVGLILASPLPKTGDTRVRGFLKKAGKFMKTVESVFLDFAKTARFETQPPRFPLVVLIFETDDDFEKYAEESTGGKGLSAGNIAGFYSGMTNWLAIRLSECNTFEVPLHEAIHQQVYNRHVLERLAPTPKWFNEGIATGFEGSGEKIDVSPQKINSNYARRALAGTAAEVNWEEVVTNDRAFLGDVLAGDAYTQAWCIHWMLCTKHKDKYSQYVQALSSHKTLETITAEERQKEFEEIFGKDVSKMQKEFRGALEAGMKRQKVAPEKKSPAGISYTQSNLAEVELTAVMSADRGLEVQGKLRNISPIRAMAYHVTVETDAGVYADWHIPSLDVKKTANLNQQIAQKRMTNGPGGSSRTFRVRVKSVATDSRDAEQWKSGSLPVPVYRGTR